LLGEQRGEVRREDRQQPSAYLVHHASAELSGLAGHVQRGQHLDVSRLAAVFEY
jgi:hypothetical protein